MGSHRKSFGRDVLGPGGSRGPVWGHGTGPSKHAVSGQLSLQREPSLFPKLSTSLGLHFNPRDQISAWILQMGEKQHFPDWWLLGVGRAQPG